MQGYLKLLVFWCGLVTLGLELSASRLLAPFFGTSLMVWSSLIGLILVCLSAGTWLGGAWADRSPRLTLLVWIVFFAAAAIALVPFVARPVLLLSLRGFADLELGLLAGSFFGVLALLGLPMILLGTVTPFAIRLTTRSVTETGRTTGGLIALSTLGSFLGSFLPVLVLIPAWGTRNTFFFFSSTLFVLAAIGAARVRKKWLTADALVAGAALALVAGWRNGGPIKPGEGLLYEAESPYHYLRVREDDEGWRSLELNEGIVTHSKYHPGLLVTGGEWDYVVAAPFFNPRPFSPMEQTRRWAIVGAGAGTSARLITEVFGPVAIDAVELDPAVVDVGRRFFDMNQPNLRVDVLDGRAWLRLNTNQYDAIVIDAYRQPYIPFELATVEFFSSVRDHLSPHGVVCVNAARTPSDLRLVHALASTLGAVFPGVYRIDLPHGRNTALVATRRPADAGDFPANMQAATHPLLRLVLGRCRTMWSVAQTGGLVFTDDHAPVERLTDLLIWGEILRQAAAR